MLQHKSAFLFAAAAVLILAASRAGDRSAAKDQSFAGSESERYALPADDAVFMSSVRDAGVPDVYAFAFLVSDAETGADIFEKDADKRWVPASLTKLVTALIVKEQMDLQARIPVSEEAAMTEGSAGDLAPGAAYTADYLMKAMLLTSSNDAAVALAQSYGKERFVSRMNETARRLQMRDTVFFDASGLSPLNQSTARDLKLLAFYILDRHPDIFEVTRKTEMTLQGKTFENINLMSRRGDFIGGKTGYLEEAQRNLLTIFQGKRGRMLAVVLGSPDYYAATEALIDHYKEAR